MFKELLVAATGVLALFGASTTSDHQLNKVRDEGRTRANSTMQIDISCVQATVAAREAALAIAMTANTQSMNSAYSTRASALAPAYSLTGKDEIRKAVKTAWMNFRAAMLLAHKGWKNAQKAAWSQFKTAMKACGTGAVSVADSENASADASTGGGSD